MVINTYFATIKAVQEFNYQKPSHLCTRSNGISYLVGNAGSGIEAELDDGAIAKFQNGFARGRAEVKMKFEEITKRLTGVSCPIFGVQWNPSESHCAVARRVVRFLEDRRVLYVPHDVEIEDYCARSVLEIRSALTEEMGKLDEGTELLESLRALRAASRRFLERIDSLNDRPRHPRYDRYDLGSHTFFTALGELRATFGIHIARIAVQHGLDVEKELASILPEKGEEE